MQPVVQPVVQPAASCIRGLRNTQQLARVHPDTIAFLFHMRFLTFTDTLTSVCLYSLYECRSVPIQPLGCQSPMNVMFKIHCVFNWYFYKTPFIIHRVSKKTSTHIIGYKLRNSCPILIVFDTKIPHII